MFSDASLTKRAREKLQTFQKYFRNTSETCEVL